jgi:hypothetical protein
VDDKTEPINYTAFIQTFPLPLTDDLIKSIAEAEIETLIKKEELSHGMNNAALHQRNDAVDCD